MGIDAEQQVLDDQQVVVAGDVPRCLPTPGDRWCPRLRSEVAGGEAPCEPLDAGTVLGSAEPLVGHRRLHPVGDPRVQRGEVAGGVRGVEGAPAQVVDRVGEHAPTIVVAWVR
jgi:hypothetical protein